MNIKRHPTRQERLFSSAVALLRTLGKDGKSFSSRNELSGCDRDYFNAVNLALENISEEGFIFQTTEKIYQQYLEGCCGKKGISNRRILPSDIELAHSTIDSVLEDVAAQEYAGYVTVYSPERIEVY